MMKVFSQGDTLISNEAALDPVDVSSVNINDTAFITFSLAYADLKEGLTLDGQPLPAEETGLGIGDYWTIVYTAVMEDGRKVVNNATTVIAVSNKYAGYYQCVGYFTHPNPASSRAIDREKFLSPSARPRV